jgi:ATP-dependent DNA helicase RecG
MPPDFYTQDIKTLPGVGDTLYKHCTRLLPDTRIISLLAHLPTGTESWRILEGLSELTVGHEHPPAGILIQVDKIEWGTAGRPHIIITRDRQGQYLRLVHFKGAPEVLKRMYPFGEKRRVYGKLIWDTWSNTWCMEQPAHVIPPSVPPLKSILPTYALVAGLYQSQIRRMINTALLRLPFIPEWLDPVFLKAQNWPPFDVALRRVHNPEHEQDIQPHHPARKRLAFDFLLGSRLALHQKRLERLRLTAPVIHPDPMLIPELIQSLPFRLTNGQQGVLEEMLKDTASGHPMHRLLMGDVGSGKTIVAALLAVCMIKAGYQVAIMAPTDILIRQHAESLTPLMHRYGVVVQLLTGREKGKHKERIYDSIKKGAVDLVLGTHALIQDEVAFNRLSLVIIDEQHRFGVKQRQALLDKGEHPHFLAMSATPIPRTLLLTHYGDMQVSLLKEKPAGRMPITTTTMSVQNLSNVVTGLERALKEGAQSYWVCPLVTESEALDLAAAEARFLCLKEAMPDIEIALIHGKMKAGDKDAALARFHSGECRLLVATTVIEVGVNVPNATIMVIEEATRFGLAQLHQLRGRVGRGALAGRCLLLYTPPLGAIAKARLNALKQSNDGFFLAEEDLRLRGGGDVLGLKQSGLPSLPFLDLGAHGDLLGLADEYVAAAGGREINVPTFIKPNEESLS